MTIRFGLSHRIVRLIMWCGLMYSHLKGEYTMDCWQWGPNFR